MGLLDGVDKKIREAEFFLGEYSKRAVLAFGDPEPADFYLSAFANAAYSIDARTAHIFESQFGKGTFKPWLESWRLTLPPADGALIKFFVIDRGAEVHASGTSLAMDVVMEPFSGFYEDASGRLEVFAPPVTLGVPEEERTPKIGRRKYTFTIDGQTWDAFDACSAWLKLEKQMVAHFRASFPHLA
jgi:hypothetical protein